MINNQGVNIIKKIGKNLLIKSKSGEYWLVKRVHKNIASRRRMNYRLTYYIPIRRIMTDEETL